MWSLCLGLIFCCVSFLPAYFDHGRRRKAFLAAIGSKEKWITGVEWIVLNWGLPFLAISITISQGLESKATDEEIRKLRDQNLTQSNRLVVAESKLKWRTITPEDEAKFVKALETAPKGAVRVWTYFNVDPGTDQYAVRIGKVLRSAGYEIGNGGVGHAMISGTIPTDIRILVTNLNINPPFSGHIQKALRDIGIQAIGVVEAGNRSDGALEIYVGLKP